jgi:hypothetical protein
MAKNTLGISVGDIQQILPHGQLDDGPINWTVLAPAPAPYEGVLVPTYLNYGGPNYSGGEVLAPGEPADFSVPALDLLDEAFKAHDAAYESTSLSVRATADIALLNSILALSDAQLSPEGHLYAAVTTFVILNQLSQYPEGTLSFPQQIGLALQTPAYVADALHNLGEAGIEPARNEVSGIVKWLNESLDTLSQIDPALVSTVSDLVSDVLPFSDALHFAGFDQSDAAYDVIEIALGGAELHFPDVALEHLPAPLLDLPEVTHEHSPGWLVVS